jgi:hypothetical protein
VEEEKGFLVRQREEWKSRLFRTPSRRRWGLVGLVISFVMIYSGLAYGTGDPPKVLTALPPFGVLEGVGALFGSLAELLPEEQSTLAGILRVWAGLFVGCGFALMVIGGIMGGGSPVP